MKRWKKIALLLVVVTAITQIPFVVRRARFSRLSSEIAQRNAGRTRLQDPRFTDFPGVIHVHTSLGGHSSATFEELIAGAKGLSFVILTEHTSDLMDTAALTLNGVYGGVLFVGGNELDTHTSDRLLLIPGTAEAYTRRNTETPEFLPPFQKEGRLAFVTYPDRFSSWDTAFDGIEVFNLNSNARKANLPLLLFDILWSYWRYPELTLTAHLSRPDAYLQKFDEISRQRKITLFAGSDAHSNLGYHLIADDAGNKHIRLKFDDYAMIFRIVRTHVLLPRETKLTQETLLAALKQGHCFVGFDALGDTAGFSFESGDRIMGDDASLGTELRIQTPQSARMVLFKDGVKVTETNDSREMRFKPNMPGTYRVEAFMDSLGSPFDSLPWIMSNPIYVR